DAQNSMADFSTSPFQSKELTCSSCGMTYHEFAKNGKFGCAHCYQAFAERLDPIFKRVHGGNTEHKGKVPKRAGHHMRTQQEIKLMRETLQKYVDKEEFEKAAELRDQIRSLEKGRDG